MSTVTAALITARLLQSDLVAVTRQPAQALHVVMLVLGAIFRLHACVKAVHTCSIKGCWAFLGSVLMRLVVPAC